jgi:hypothetical protein
MKALKIEGTRGQYRLHAEDCRILARSPRRWQALDVLGGEGALVQLGTEGEPFRLHKNPRDLLTCRSCWERCTFDSVVRASMASVAASSYERASEPGDRQA